VIGTLNGLHEDGGRAESQMNQDRSYVDLGKEKRVEDVLPTSHRHSHVRRGMVGTVESPQHGTW